MAQTHEDSHNWSVKHLKAALQGWATYRDSPEPRSLYCRHWVLFLNHQLFTMGFKVKTMTTDARKGILDPLEKIKQI